MKTAKTVSGERRQASKDRAEARENRRVWRDAWEDAIRAIAAVLSPGPRHPSFPEKRPDQLVEHPMSFCASGWCTGVVGEKCGRCGGCHMEATIESAAALSAVVRSMPRSRLRRESTAAFHTLRAALGALEEWIDVGASAPSPTGMALRTIERRSGGLGAKGTAERGETREIEHAGLMADLRSAGAVAMADVGEPLGWTGAETLRRLIAWQMGGPRRRRRNGTWERPPLELEAIAEHIGAELSTVRRVLLRSRRLYAAELIARGLLSTPNWTKRNDALRRDVELRTAVLGAKVVA